jgi:hypothetical protein
MYQVTASHLDETPHISCTILPPKPFPSLSDKGEKDNFHFSRSSGPSVP